MTGDVGDLALLDLGGRGGGRVAGTQRVPGELWEQLGGKVGGPRLLMISATDWSVRRSAPTVSPRRIRRNTGPRWIFAAGSHWLSARTAAPVCVTRVGDRDLRSRLLLVGL